MPFYPDIVVTEVGSSHPLLVVEAKATEATADGERQLRHYMWEMSCPVGLLASPKKIAIFRNLFTGYADNSIEKTGVFSAPPSWSKFGDRNGDFELHVQRWLEDLTNGDTDLSHEAQDAFQQWLVPGLLNGDIHAAGPRISR